MYTNIEGPIVWQDRTAQQTGQIVTKTYYIQCFVSLLIALHMWYKNSCHFANKRIMNLLASENKQEK